MATLIQSKQIQGVVTASVIEGDFEVGGGGSVNLSGASGVTGSFTGSFKGDGSGLTFGGTGIVSRSSQLIPTFDGLYLEIDGDNVVSSSDQITISQTSGYTTFSSSLDSRLVSLENATDNTGSDTQTLSISGQTLTISSGNSITLPSGGGGGTSDFTELTNVPSGLVSSSIQITDGSGIVSGSVLRTLDGTGVLSGSVVTSLPSGIISGSTFTSFSASIDSRIDGISAGGAGADWNLNLQNIPSGLVSGSVLRTLDGTGVVSGSVLRTLDGTGVLSGSITSQLPSGVVSGSSQITDGSNIVSGSVLRNLEGTGVISGSVLRTLDGTGVVSGSVLRTLDGTGVVSGSVLRTLDGTDVVSGSVVRTLDGTNIFSGSLLPGSNITITSGSGNITISSSGGGSVPAGTISGSAQVISSLPSGVISGSSQLPSGVVSGSSQITDGSGILSGSIESQLPAGIISGSTYTNFSSSVDSRILSEKTRIDNILDGANADYDQFVEIVNLVNSTDTENDTAFANHYTSSRQRDASLEAFTASIDTTIKTKLNTDDVLSGSIESLLPSGVISGSTQLTDGSGIFSGSLVAGTNVTINQVGDNFIISSSASGGSSNVTVSDSAPGSPSQGDLWWKSDDGNLYIYYDGYWVISTDITTGLPAGVVSGSTQITDGSNIVSGSVLRTLDGTNVFSGSLIGGSNVTITSGSGNITISSSGGGSTPSGTISGSAQITSLGFISESFSTDGTNIVSGSVLRTLDGTGVVSGSVLRTLDGTGVVSGSVITTLDGTGVVSGSVVRTLDGTGVISGSDQISFNGNRVVSQEKLPTMFTSSFNPGTSGSVIDFLNAIFYPNTEPTITTGNQTIEEYTSNGSTIVTIAGTDPEGQALTFGTASSYTDDLVRVASNGVLTLNALAESSSFNTDLVGGVHGHTFTATATDTFNATIEKDITVFVTPNEAPKFREGSTGGNVITSVTSNLNENSTNNTLVKRVFFTDAEGDTITITTSSIDNNHFDVTIYGTYLDIRQNTGSLDYEQQTTYNFSITASDEHFESGEDSDSRTFLPITVNVTDNLAPTINNQTLSSINENSSNGASVGTISATDNEGDSISFVTFDLHKLELDNVNVPSGSYGGTSQATDPHENPFQMDSSGNVSRKTGVVINSDLINEYQYRVQVRDNFNSTISNVAIVTIPITDDTPATLSDNWSAGPYIKESEESGATMKTTNYGSAAADYDSNQSGTWSSSNSAISINSNGNLLLGVDLSGSVTQSGDTLDSTITFTNSFGTTTTDSLSVIVVANSAPTATFTNQTSNLNANLATTNTNLVLVGISDTESDTPYSASLSGTDASKLNLSYQNSNSSSVYIRANENLSAATYNYNIRVTDNYGKSTDYNSRTITIASASTGSLGGDTSIYIVESAVSEAVYRDATGFNQGNAAQLSVSYSPNYGSAVVQSYTSSRQGVSVDSSGNLTAGYDFSGSVTSTDYTSTALVSDSTNSTLYGKSLHVNGIKVVQGAATGSQSAVPDAFTEKVAQTIKLMVTSSGADINDTDQANMIGILKGETGTWHSGYPTAQRILRGAGSDYSPNPLIDSNYSSYSGLQNFQDSHATDDMIWYLNSSAASGSGDADIVEVIEHLMHTIHQYGVRGAVSGSYNELSWDPETDSDWNTRELYYAIKEAVDDSVFDISDYGDASYNTAATFKLIAKEYLYLLNFNMWEYSSLWSGGSLSPEWNDNSRTPSGIQTNNPLGYALYNKYIKPVLTKPSKTVLQNIFQDGDVGDPTIAGSSGYTPEVGTGLISEITFRDQYDNIGSGSVTVNVFDNQAPTVTFTNQTANFETDLATTGTTMVSMSISDTESDTPFSASLTGTDASSLQLKYTNSNSSSVGIQASTNLSAATYNYNVKVTDNFGKSREYNSRSFTVDTSADNGKVYLYDVGFSNSTYNTAVGISSEDSSTPPIATPYSNIGFVDAVINDDILGDSTFTYPYGSTQTATKLAEASGSNLHDVLRSMGSSGTISRSSTRHFVILFPSGSDMSGIPTSTTAEYGDNTVGRYTLEVGGDGTTIDGTNTIEASEINQFTLATSHVGFTKWFMVGASNQFASSTSINLGLNPSSGSGGV